jgi:antitoxin component of MazEF toxin-antitoxin module
LVITNNKPMNNHSKVKLQKVGNSQAVIIPSKFLKEIGDTSEVQMEIDENEIRLVFVKNKSLQSLIDEKRFRNKGKMAEMMNKVEKWSLSEPDEDYIISTPDDLID